MDHSVAKIGFEFAINHGTTNAGIKSLFLSLLHKHTHTHTHSPVHPLPSTHMHVF